MSYAWRKLLSNPPPEWQRLSLITRGVGNEILRALDSDGRIDCGNEDVASCVCRILGAHPKERKRIREAIDELVAEGFLSIESGAVNTLSGHLPDLAGGRKKRRARPEEGRREGGESSERGRSESGNEANPAQPLNSAPVEEKRKEEKREDKIRRARGLFVAAFTEYWQRDPKRFAWSGAGPHHEALDHIATWIVDSDAEAHIPALLDGFFADPFAIGTHWSINVLAKEPSRFLAPKRPAKSGGWQAPATADDIAREATGT